MFIKIGSEAGETFRNLVNKLEGYTVEVTPSGATREINAAQRHNAVDHLPSCADLFDATLIGWDKASGWYDQLVVQPMIEVDGEMQAVGPRVSVRVHQVLVY